MRAGILLELGLERSRGDDAEGLAEAVRLTALEQLRDSDLGFDDLRVDVAARRVVLHIERPRVQDGRCAAPVDPAPAVQQLLERVAQDCAWNERPLGESVCWLLALHGQVVLPVAWGELRAGRMSRGHARLAPGEIEVPSAGRYVDVLGAAHVRSDFRVRERQLREALDAASGVAGGGWLSDEGLLARWVARTEAPVAVVIPLEGRTEGWPRGLAQAVLRDCVNGFTVLGPGQGGAALACLWVADGRAEATALAEVRRHLEARLAELARSLQEQRKRPLRERARQLEARSYQEGLGSLADKQRRTLALALHLTRPARRLQLSRLAPLVGAELASDVAADFAELRGELGRWLVRTHGLSPELAPALDYAAEPEHAATEPPSELRAALLLGDAFDTVLGAFLIGKGPTGTVDALGARSAARGFAREAVEGPVDVNLRALVRTALAGHASDLPHPTVGATGALALVRRELTAALAERLPHDVLEGVMAAWHDGWVGDLRARAQELAKLRASAGGRSLLLSLQRCYAWTRDMVDCELDTNLLREGSERALWEANERARLALTESLAARDAVAAVAAVASLGAPLGAFFDEVRVVSEPPGRGNVRTALLASVLRTTHQLAHFHRVAVPRAP